MPLDRAGKRANGLEKESPHVSAARSDSTEYTWDFDMLHQQLDMFLLQDKVLLGLRSISKTPALHSWLILSLNKQSNELPYPTGRTGPQRTDQTKGASDPPTYFAT